MKFGISDLTSPAASDTDSDSSSRKQHRRAPRRRTIRFSSSSSAASSDDSFDTADHDAEGSSFLDESFTSPFDVGAHQRKVGRSRRPRRSQTQRGEKEGAAVGRTESGRFGLNGGRKQEEQDGERSPSRREGQQRDLGSS